MMLDPTKLHLEAQEAKEWASTLASRKTSKSKTDKERRENKIDLIYST